MRSLFLLAIVPILAIADAPAARTPRDALQPFNDLIGTWRGTGTPMGTREDKQKGFWTESLACEWQFKGADAWIKVDFKDGKYFQTGTLRYLAARDQFELSLLTTSKETQVFAGPLQKKTLLLERELPQETQRLVFTFLHANRFLYRYETRAKDKTLFAKLYEVGVTKEGEAFAVGSGKPECIVSGGLGTTPVTYKGQTYYVCCSGCKTEFYENPEKYVMEFLKKKEK